MSTLSLFVDCPLSLRASYDACYFRERVRGSDDNDSGSDPFS